MASFLTSTAIVSDIESNIRTTAASKLIVLFHGFDWSLRTNETFYARPSGKPAQPRPRRRHDVIGLVSAALRYQLAGCILWVAVAIDCCVNCLHRGAESTPAAAPYCIVPSIQTTSVPSTQQWCMHVSRRTIVDNDAARSIVTGRENAGAADFSFPLSFSLYTIIIIIIIIIL